MLKQPDFERAKLYARSRLEHELPAYLRYHSAHHTRDEVVPAVELLAGYQDLDDGALLLLMTAAWYHDIGFVEQPFDHEAVGVRIAGKVLPRFGYSLPQIAVIGGMIMATKLPQAPQTMLECILADADLERLGSTDFWPRNADLRAELAAQGTELSDGEWYSDQLDFLTTHRYWTATARTLCDAQKQRNIESLVMLIEQHKGAHEHNRPKNP